MSEYPVLTCTRCGHRHIGAPLLHRIPSLHVCPLCGLFVVVRELGEMANRDDRADPADWGGVG